MELKDVAFIVGALTTIITPIAVFFKAKGMDEVQQKMMDEKLKELHSIDEKQWKEIDAGKEWETRHEKEAAERRLALELKISAHDGVMKVLSEKIDAILQKLDALIREVKNGYK